MPCHFPPMILSAHRCRAGRFFYFNKYYTRNTSIQIIIYAAKQTLTFSPSIL